MYPRHDLIVTMKKKVKALLTKTQEKDITALMIFLGQVFGCGVSVSGTTTSHGDAQAICIQCTKSFESDEGEEKVTAKGFVHFGIPAFAEMARQMNHLIDEMEKEPIAGFVGVLSHLADLGDKDIVARYLCCELGQLGGALMSDDELEHEMLGQQSMEVPEGVTIH